MWKILLNFEHFWKCTPEIHPLFRLRNIPLIAPTLTPGLDLEPRWGTCPQTTQVLPQSFYPATPMLVWHRVFVGIQQTGCLHCHFQLSFYCQSCFVLAYQYMYKFVANYLLIKLYVNLLKLYLQFIFAVCCKLLVFVRVIFEVCCQLPFNNLLKYVMWIC